MLSTLVNRFSRDMGPLWAIYIATHGNNAGRSALAVGGVNNRYAVVSQPLDDRMYGVRRQVFGRMNALAEKGLLLPSQNASHGHESGRASHA